MGRRCARSDRNTLPDHPLRKKKGRCRVDRHGDRNVQHLVPALTIQDRIPDGSYEAIVLAGESPDSYNDIEHPERVVPRRTTPAFANGVVHLPPHSLSIVRLTLSSQLRIRFSATEYDCP